MALHQLQRYIKFQALAWGHFFWLGPFPAPRIGPSLLFSLLSLNRKVRLINHQPVCPSLCLCVPPNNFWTNRSIFMKFSRKVMSLKVTPTPYLLIPYLQAFQNGGRSNFWGGCKTCTSQRGNIKFCILINLQRMNNF
jgi:hypothetical protein